MLSIPVEQRRARLARRHHLDGADGAPPGSRSPVAITEALVALHATDPATPYLSLLARDPDFRIWDLEEELYGRRTLHKHLCMRRTLFVVSSAVRPLVHHACSIGVASTQRKRLVADVEKGALAVDGARWLDRAAAATLDALPNRVRCGGASCPGRCRSSGPSWSTPRAGAGVARSASPRGS